MVRVYVTAPRESAAQVRTIHAEIERIGCKPTSIWADLSLATTDNLDIERSRAHHVLSELSTKALDDSHVLLVLAEGKHDTSEMCFEVGRASAQRKPIMWLGARKVLACYTPDFHLVHDIKDAIWRIQKASVSPLQLLRDIILCGPEIPECPKCGNKGVKPNPMQDGKDWYCAGCHTLFDRLRTVASA